MELCCSPGRRAYVNEIPAGNLISRPVSRHSTFFPPLSRRGSAQFLFSYSDAVVGIIPAAAIGLPQTKFYTNLIETECACVCRGVKYMYIYIYIRDPIKFPSIFPPVQSSKEPGVC